MKRQDVRSDSKQSKIKGLIMRFARGNVALQSGHYVTAEDKAKLRKKVTSHKFV